MHNEQITVLASIQAKPEKQDEVKRELLKIVEQTHAEEGCIQFDLHQSINDPYEFRLSEMWISQEALDEHLKKPYIKNFLDKSEELLVKPPDISLWKMISVPK
jgi:quinol monooxygenase YgiN